MKTNASALAIVASLAFVTGASAKEPLHVDHLPKVGASTIARQIAQAQGAVNESIESEFPVVPGGPNRLALEYRLGTHVEALAMKYGQLDQAGKRCNIEGSYFEEDALADVLGNALPESSVGIAKRSYAEGQTLDTPPCNQMDKFVNRLLAQVERHKKAISHEAYHLMLMNSEGRN